MLRLPAHRPAGGLFLLAIALAPRLAAQLAPLTVPRGLVRFDIGGRLDTWDRRYLDGVKQDAASDFIRASADGLWLPSLGQAQDRLRQVTGINNLSLTLGHTTSSLLATVGTSNLGAAYGLTRRITLFGNVPIVRVRVQNRFRLDSTGTNSGLNPASDVFGTTASRDQYFSFTTQFANALSKLSQRIASGVYAGDPDQLARAQATLARGTALKTDVEALYATAFLPLLGTPAGIALLTSIDTVRTRLSGDLGVPDLQLLPPLPKDTIGTAKFEEFVTNPLGPIAGRPFTPPVLSYLGDIELGGAFLWLDSPAKRRGGLAVRSVIQGLVRLRTAQLDKPDDFFDLPTGDRQPDVQGDVVTDLQTGRFGIRLAGRYVLQLAGRQSRRVAPPDQPFAPVGTLAAMQRNPGEVIEFGAEPFVQVTSRLALAVGARHWTKGEDRYSYVKGQDPIADTTPDVLAVGSKEQGTLLTAGLSFVHDGTRANGTHGMPMDVSFRWERILSAPLGRVPDRQSMSLALHLYGKIF